MNSGVPSGPASTNWRISSYVRSPMTTFPGSAKVWIRFARFVVSPIAVKLRSAGLPMFPTKAARGRLPPGRCHVVDGEGDVVHPVAVAANMLGKLAVG